MGYNSLREFGIKHNRCANYGIVLVDEIVNS